MMHSPNTIQLITDAWTDSLAQFARKTEFELLLVSPWVTAGAAALIASSLARQREIALKIIARLDTGDFESGASQIESFCRSTYPPSTHLEVRAIGLLHAEFLISGRNGKKRGQIFILERAERRTPHACGCEPHKRNEGPS